RPHPSFGGRTGVTPPHKFAPCRPHAPHAAARRPRPHARPPRTPLPDRPPIRRRPARRIPPPPPAAGRRWASWRPVSRSEEHTSELQSRFDLVCRLLLEKKKKNDRSRQGGGGCVTAIG